MVAVNTPVNPRELAPPAASYSHAYVSPAGSSLIHTSGVVPIRRDGSVPAGIVDQVEVVWANIRTILGAAGFLMSEVVSVTTYVVAGEDLGDVMAARDRAMAGHRPASTLVVVPQLARPEWRVEIAVVAAQS